MRNFKTRPAAFLTSFRLQPIIKLKNLSAAVNAIPDVQPWFYKEGVNQKLFIFAPKLPDLSPVLNELMQLKCVADGA